MCSLLLRFQDHYPEISSIKPFTLLLFGMLLSCLIHKDKLAKRTWKQDKIILWMLLLSIFGLLLLHPGDLINQTYLFLCSIALYYFASRILQTPMQIIILFVCLGISVAYLGYLAIEDVAMFPETTDYIDHSTGRWQGLGYYANSNEFGQLMITTIPFLLASILIRKTIFLSILSIGLMSVMLYIMVKSESRTVMVTMGLMVVGTFMLRGKGNIVKKGLVGGIMSILMLTVLTFMPGPIQERMSTVLDAGNDESFQGRTRSWDHGFAMLSWYPLTGVGKGQWMNYHGLMPHNSYVQVMAEMGIFGIWLYLWVIWLSICQFKPLFQENDNQAQGPPEQDAIFDSDDLNTAAAYDSEGFDGLKDMADLANFDESYETEDIPEAKSLPPLSNLEKTVTIAGLITFAGWLLYIFLGNQGYSIWMYFYLGLCAAYGNFLVYPDEDQPKNSFQLKDFDT